MADFNSVFDQYMATAGEVPAQPASITDTKRASVTAAAEQKKSAMGGGILPSFDQAYQTSVGANTGQGLNTMSEVERDIRTLRPIQLRAKYGDGQAAALMGQANLANQAVLLDGSTNRSGGQVARDTAVDIASGFVMPPLQIGAMGLGMFNADAGVVAANALGKFDKFIRNDLQTDELGQRRKLNEARNALDSRDSAAQQKVDLANGDDALLAGLKRLGRGAINAVGNAMGDSAILGSGIANGVGSLFSGSVLGKGAVAILPMAAKGAAMPFSISAMESAEVYQQTADEISNTSLAQLEQTSQDFKELVATGVSPEDARTQLANKAGLRAAASTAPVAIAAGKLVSKFESNPFARTSLRTMGKDGVHETFEEGIQSGWGAAAQNEATQRYVDPNKDRWDNVGEQVGEGGLYGFGTATAIHAPGAARNAVTDSSKYLWGKASGAMADAAARLEAKNEADSPLAPNKIAAEVAATQAAMPEAATAIQAGIDTSSLNQEEKAEVQEFANKLTGYINFTPEDDPANIPPEHPAHAILSGSKNNVDSLNKLAAAVISGDATNPTQTQLIAADLLQQQAAFLQSVLDESPVSMNKLPADHPAVQNLDSIKSTLNKVLAQPAVKKALAKVAEVVAQAQANGVIAPVTEESLATPEGQLNAQNAVNAIAYDPAKANPALVNAVLAHAASGKLTLTSKQQRGIAVAKTLFDMSREDFANRERLGLKTQDVVSNQIQSAEYLGEGQLSAVQHASKIYQAYRANDIAGAKFQLEDMRKFAESIQNKLAAFNQHLQNGESSKAVPYVTLGQTDRMFKNAETGVFVRPKNESSIRLMQDVAADAKMIAAAYNNLKDTFSELNGQELKAVALDSRIDKPAAEVVATFKIGTQPDASPATPVVESKPGAEPKKKTKKAEPLPPIDTSAADAAFEASLPTRRILTDEPVVDKKEEKVDASPAPVKETAKTEQVVQEDGPLPWETDKEFNQRTAAPEPIKESIATPAAESLQAVEHDLDAETKLLNTLARALGVATVSPIKALSSIQGIGKIRGGIYFGDVAGIGIDDALVGAPRLSVLLHEFGHHVTYTKIADALGKTVVQVQEMTDKQLLAAFRQSVPEVAAEYTSWLADRKAATLIETGGKARIRIPLFMSALSNVIYQALENKTLPIKLNSTRISTFHEWVADNIGKALERNTKTQGVVAQFFKSIADAFVKIYEMVAGTKALENFMPAKSVEAWIEGMLEATAEPVKEAESVVATTTEPAAVSSLVQEEETDPIVEEDTAEPAEYKGKETGLRITLPNLFGVEQTGNFVNRFVNAFIPPTEPTSRVYLADDALEKVWKALKDDSALGTFMEGSAKPGFTPEVAEAYQAYLAQVGEGTSTNPGVLLQLQKQMRDFLYAPMKNGKKRIDSVLSPAFAGIWKNGKLISLLENTDQGLQYDSKLLEGAVLAGLQWLISSDQLTSKLTDEAVANILGIDGAVPAGVTDMLNVGQSQLDALSALTSKIQNYWGLKANKDYPLGHVVGIPASMAAEVLRAFEELGLMEKRAFNFDANGYPSGKGTNNPASTATTHNRLIINMPKEIQDILAKYPDAIEQAVMVTPEQVVYLEDERPEVARTQMHNPMVNNSRQQIATIEANQETPYKVTPIYKLYESLGIDNLLKLFGFGNLSQREKNTKFNKNHLVSIEGKNQGILSTIAGMDFVMRQVKHRAEALGKPVEDIAVHYGFNMSKVSRLQMIGRATPQGDKLVRAALSPHVGTLNLNNKTGKDYRNFLLSLAQAVGIKVHNILPKIVYKQMQSLLDKELAESVGVLQEWLKTGQGKIDSRAVEIFVDNFKTAGKDLSELSLQALTEYARYKNTPTNSKARKEFKTQLYLEADGMTNGPANAMMMHTTGPFTVDQLNKMPKVGYYPGQMNRTAQENFKDDSVDLYRTAALDVGAELPKMLEHFKKQSPEVGQQMEHLLNLMSLLFNKDIKFDGNNLVIERGITKNPLTIAIYGSGTKGIASNLVSQLSKAIYKKMSDLAAASTESNVNEAEVMFGSDTDQAKAKYAQFNAAMAALTNNRVLFSKENGTHYLKNVPSNVKRTAKNLNEYAVNFTLDKGEIDNLVSNMLTLFMTPLKQAIDRTVGESLLTSMDLIQKATQIQSLYLENAFQVEIERALDKKEKDDPSFLRSDFLSENELNAIRQKLKYMVPTINTGTQEYFIAGSASADVESATEYGSSLNDQYKTPAFVYGPRDSGVSGTASINIGAGDAQMVQNIYSQPDRPTRTMPVFDGINFSLDTFEDDSLKANKAAFDAWMGNPLEAIYKSFDTFMQDTDTSMKRGSPVLFEKLSKMFFGMKVDLDTVDNAMIQEGLQGIRESLKAFSLQTEARHRALKQIGASVDQMAAASAPYQHAGSVSVEGLSREEIVTKLNELYEAEYTKLVPEKTKSQDITDALFGDAKGQLIVATADGLPFLGSRMNIPQDQKWMFNELTKSKALAVWTFIAGTKEQIREEALKRGVLAEHLDNLEKGLMVQGQQLILLPTASSETLVHEMIHAATFSTTYQHYSGELTGDVSTSVAAAVERLEGLMNQFMTLSEELPTLSTETMQQYLHARSVIQGHLNQGENALAQASALNEFMAYTQSNPALIRMTKNTKVSALVRIAKEVLEAIKEMIWGKRAPRVGGDMFTNIRFNTALLARYQPSVGQVMGAANAALAHTAATVGNPRLHELRDYFLKKIPNHLKTPVDHNNFGTAAANIHATTVAAQAAITAAQHGFRMDHLEDSTFTAIVQSLATQAAIAPNSMARAQELFTLATKKLEINDFIDPTNTDSASALYYAKEQYELVMGEYQRGIDKLGRSTLLPVFLGLAMVNNHFRSVLSKLELPKSKLKEWNTADNAFENLGKMGLDALSSRLSGEGKHAPNVQAALDALTNHLLKTAQYDAVEELVEGALDWREGRLNKRNNRLVGYMNKAGKALYTASTSVLNNPEYGKLSKSLAQLGKLTSAIINEENADIISQGIISTINKVDGFRSLREVLADMVGRTENNAEIYDQNKLVRSMVSQDRQHYRDDLPEIIRSKFSRDVTDPEMTAMFHGLAKTDIALLRESMKNSEIRELFTKTSALPVAIRAVEAQLKATDPKHWSQVEKKARQLAGFMNGKGAGTNLLRNAEAVSGLFSEKVDPKRAKPDDTFIKAVDKLITFYALDDMNNVHKDALFSLVQSEADGVDFVMAYLTGQRAEEMRKAQASPTSRENYFKGYIPSEQDSSVSLIVANDSEFSKLALKSFTRVESYKGSSLIGGEPKSYYFAKVPGRAPYNQGTMQNVRQTAGGIDLSTGFTDGMMVAGRITDPRMVFKLTQNMANERATNEPLMPIYNNGMVVAFERAVDPLQLERIKQNTDIAKMIGVWRGRQVEEAKVQVFNEALVDAAKRMHKTDLQNSSASKAEYINVLDPKEQKKDPVMADAVRLLNPETLAYIENVFGEGNFPVRKDMLNDMLGYRNATVGDLWTGNHRWSPEVENAVKNIAISAFGNKAYQYLVNYEKIAQNVVSSAKTLIVMKSIVVPVANLIGNVYQLASRGIPLMAIARGLPRKALEIDSYAKSRTREVEVEAELRAAEGDAVATRRLTTEWQSIKDSHKRLSIWPLIEAGQFSAISDMGVSRDEVSLTEGKLHDYIEGLVDRLPESIRNAGRYALVTKDTALFQGLQKSVDYGDFVAKAVLYDDLTKRKEMTSAQALARITEEFVNYDRLPGRTRGYLENMGLLWFYNFKLRLVKIALSTIRNNPVHALMVGMMPKPDIFGSIGTPVTDNLFSKALSGGLSNSIGPGMLFNAPMLLPTVNAVFD